MPRSAPGILLIFCAAACGRSAAKPAEISATPESAPSSSAPVPTPPSSPPTSIAKIEIRNGGKPGSLEIVAHEAISLDAKLLVESATTAGTFEPLLGLDLDSLKLVESCKDKVGPCVSLAEVEHVPHVEVCNRVKVEACKQGFYQVTASYGYAQHPNVEEVMQCCAAQGIDFEGEEIVYYLGRDTLRSTGHSGMWGWRKNLFIYLARNARSAVEFFGLPPGKVVEMGIQIEL